MNFTVEYYIVLGHVYTLLNVDVSGKCLPTDCEETCDGTCGRGFP